MIMHTYNNIIRVSCFVDSPSIGGVSSSSAQAVGPIVGGIFNDEIDYSQFTLCIISL